MQCSSHVQDVARMHPEFQAVSGTWCTGHDRDASGPRQGRSLIFRLFLEVFGHGVQATSGMCRGQGRDGT
ncbi:Hypothetical predicted protein [Olea europaea subsp. europaea]|uniref:Uncharacterized protein n=1 Tax=Olea europaea subsp. europaea TaxID=158383 RepID=A0A8S0PL44_OLEEU|nr:Hypothetical predicted protein [Olea europaea subsp. europaea]